MTGSNRELMAINTGGSKNENQNYYHEKENSPFVVVVVNIVLRSRSNRSLRPHLSLCFLKIVMQSALPNGSKEEIWQVIGGL